ncbi:protein-tyrosine phosphatase-like protein [Amylocystis lapponica]|nr:protein-tyrosine phosphatase-like protein [Amylocystis lapponica]
MRQTKFVTLYMYHNSSGRAVESDFSALKHNPPHTASISCVLMAKGKGKAAKQQLASSKDAATLILPPNIFLGPCSAASSSKFLSAEGITHILSIGSTPASRLPNITYERLPLTDSPSSSISQTVESAVVFIDGARLKNGKVLLHCSAAISRSPTVLAGYLMKSQGMTLVEALGMIVIARPTVSPNSGFLAQLKEMEKELRGSITLEMDELPRRKEEREAVFKDVQRKTQSEAAAKQK